MIGIYYILKLKPGIISTYLVVKIQKWTRMILGQLFEHSPNSNICFCPFAPGRRGQRWPLQRKSACRSRQLEKEGWGTQSRTSPALVFSSTRRCIGFWKALWNPQLLPAVHLWIKVRPTWWRSEDIYINTAVSTLSRLR